MIALIKLCNLGNVANNKERGEVLMKDFVSWGLGRVHVGST